MLRRVLLLLVCLLALVVQGHASGKDPFGNEPFSPVPVPPWPQGSYQHDISKNLYEGIAATLGHYFGDEGWVYTAVNPTSGLHGIANSCVSPAFSTDAFTSSGLTLREQDHVTADGHGGSVTINYAAVGCNCTNQPNAWVIISSTSSDTLGNFHRSGTSNLFVNCTDTSEPALPPLSAWLLSAQLSGGLITGVVDKRVTSPLGNKALGGNLEKVLHMTIVSLHASGTGTAPQCWTGWDTAIDWTQSNHVYFFPSGCYTQAADIRVSGQRAHVLGAGVVTVTINYTGTGTAWWFEAPNSPCASTGAQCTIGEPEFAGFFLTPTDQTHNKTAIRIANFSQGYIHDIWASGWKGAGTSTAFHTYGRDNNVFERLVLDADIPLHISENASWTEAGLDSTVFRGLFLLGNTATSNPCILADDHIDITTVSFEPEQAWNLCNGGFYWVNTTSTRSSQGGLRFQGTRWEQSTDQTAWMYKIIHPIGVQNLTIEGAYGGTTGNGIWLQGLQGTATIKDTWWIGAFGNANNSGVGLKVQNSAGIQSARYVSGGTITGTVGQTCTCNAGWNNSGGSVCSGSPHVTFALSGTNTIAAGTVSVFPAPFTPGSGCTGFPTQCTLGNGTANCSGTAVITTILNGTGNAGQLNIISSFLDGDKTFNTLGLDPCTGASGYPTGSHNCIMGMTQFFGLHRLPVGQEDTGTNAIYVDTSYTTAGAYASIAGNIFTLPPPGVIPPTVVPLSGHMAAGQEPPAPWLTTLDCPTGLAPCTGTFKTATFRLRIVADDQSFSEFAILTVDPTSFAAFPNLMTCVICTPHIDANQGAGTTKVVLYHPAVLPPNGFYTLHNGTSVGVTWMGFMEITY